MKRFLTSIYFKISIIIVIVEVLILTLIGTVYLNRLFTQIDQRVLERSQLLGNLIKANLVRIVSINDPEAMRLLVGEEIVDVFLASPDQTIFYSHDRSLVGKSIQNIEFTNADWFDESKPTETIERVNDEQGSYIINVVPISLGTEATSAIDFFLYTRINTTEAETEKRGLIILLAVGTVATIITTSIIIIIAFNLTLLRRIRTLVAVMRQVEDGNLSVQLTGKITDDELGILERGANSMLSQLNNLFETLEQRVHERTRDLTIAEGIARKITTDLNKDDLLADVVTITQAAFSLYQVNIFLLDEDTQELTLAAASGSSGDAIRKSGLKHQFGGKGLIPSSAAERKAAISNNVADSAVFLRNPLLPDTRSEAAIPIIFSETLYGVLDLQSEVLGRFDPRSVELFTAFANQIAIALRNAALFEEAEVSRKRAEESDHVKSAFLATMSHELRTPLNAIINFSKFVGRGLLGPVQPQQEEAMQNVVGSAEHLLALINDVLDISKIEAGSLQLFKESTDLTQLLLTVENTAKSLLHEKPVHFTTDIDPHLPIVTADTQRILQVILNIISNACKFTKEGEIHLSACVQEDTILVTVKDTGPGIASEEHSAVFEKFKQTHAGLRQGGGTGLGMPISRSLIEAHGGQMWLESELGHGASFKFTLPIATEKV